VARMIFWRLIGRSDKSELRCRNEKSIFSVFLVFGVVSFLDPQPWVLAFLKLVILVISNFLVKIWETLVFRK